MSAPLHLVFIASVARSGSTLLNRMLGTLDRVLSLGELVPPRAPLHHRSCSCTLPFSQCPFWSAAAHAAFGAGWALELTRLHEVSRSSLRDRNVAPLLLPGRGWSDSAELRRLSDGLTALLFAARGLSSCSVLVDSSHNPLVAAALSEAPGIRVHLVHLIRDPRGCAHSLSRGKRGPTAADAVPRLPLRRAVRGWLTRNLACEVVGARLGCVRLRYEDLVARPGDELARVLAGIPPLTGRPVPSLVGKRVDLPRGHIIAGNPDRFASGPTDLLPDERWRAEMSRWERTFVTAATLPAMVRYGYASAESRPACSSPARNPAP